MLYFPLQPSGLQDDELSAVEFCFELLSRIISVTIARTETESETTYSPLELLSSIFNSQLTKAFLEGIFQPNTEIDDKPKSKRKKGSSCKAAVVFSEKIGDLLNDTLVHYPEFKATAGFDYCFKKLLNCLESWRSDSSQCT